MVMQILVKSILRRRSFRYPFNEANDCTSSELGSMSVSCDAFEEDVNDEEEEEEEALDSSNSGKCNGDSTHHHSALTVGST